MICELEFQFSGIPIWVKTDVDTTEILSALKTRRLKGQMLDRIKLFDVSSDVESNSFVYDFTQAQQDTWSIVTVTSEQTEED